MSTQSEKLVRELFDIAGVTVNGSSASDITIHNDQFYDRIIKDGELGLGESYMDNWWDAPEPDQFIDKIMRAGLDKKIRNNWSFLIRYLTVLLFNRQSKKRAFQVGEQHYDIDIDLYSRMLDKRMQYTCAYWKNADTLDQAQHDKLALVCRKLDLKPGMKILELGCGYGGFAHFAATRYGVEVKGYTVSKKQAEYGRQLNKDLPVEICLEDYRKASGQYDRVVSIGLMEHVGTKNYRTYMEKTHDCLKDGGLAFIHTIGHNLSTRTTNAWIEKYIFPNGKLPSISQLSKSMEGLFVVEDWHNFGEDYDKTLMAWFHNFKNSWHEIEDNYSERFYRMWAFYLLSCAGGFRSRTLQLWQIVLTKTGTPAPDCRKS